MNNNRTQKVKSFFDKTNIYLRKDFGVRVRAGIAKDLLGDEVINKKIIDLGCGNGGVSLQFLTKAQKMDFLDLSNNMLDLVKEQIPTEYNSKVSFINLDLEEINVTNKYDIIIAYGLIMHVNSPIESLKKMYEMLEPGGLLLTHFTNYKHPISRINKFFKEKGSYNVNNIDRHLFKSISDSVGFKIVKSKKYALLLIGLGKLPNEWLYKFDWWTYKSKWISKLGMDEVYLLKKI